MKDNLIMSILEKAGIGISREAAMIMLEYGTLTEERQFSDYIAVNNVNEALSSKPELAKEILARGLNQKQTDNLIQAYYSFIQ